jgi:alpha-N-acetylglucosaminidase
MYKTLTAVDKDAIWLQMAWMFYHQKKDWTPERIKALLTGVPNGKMMLLDYHCENVELWKDTNRFHGQPYIWCYLGNFGGNTTLTGNVVESGKRLENTLVNGGKNLSGIGSTLEGLDIVQFPFEYVFDKAWHHSDGNDYASWISNLADRHVGRESAPMREAMQILFNEIYTQVPRTLAILPNLRPEMDNNGKSRTSINYNPERLEYVWQLLCQVDSVDTDAFVIDLVSVGRQVLGNRFAVAKRQFDEAYHKRDKAALRKHATEMQMLLGNIDALCSTHPYADVATWISDARNLAKTDEVADYYERNARNLITTWGGRLNDYASRTLSGLTSQYYAGRWQIYIDAVMDAVSNGQELDAAQLASRLKSFEELWTSPAQVPSPRYYDPLTLSRSLIISR